LVALLNIRSCSEDDNSEQNPCMPVVSGKHKGRGFTERKGELRMRTTLWVTTAAAALIASATFAGAQTGKTNEGGAGSSSGQTSQSPSSSQKGAASEHKSPGMAQGKEERGEK